MGVRSLALSGSCGAVVPENELPGPILMLGDFPGERDGPLALELANGSFGTLVWVR